MIHFLGEITMSKGQTLQDPFLNSLRKDRIPVSIFLVNGIKLQGQIESFDQYVVLLKNTVSQMVYKHAISTVVPARNPRTATGTLPATANGTFPQATGMGFERPAGFESPQYGGAGRGFGTVTSRTPSFANNNERGFGERTGFDNGFDNDQQRGFTGGAGFGGGFDRSGFGERGFDAGFENKGFENKGFDSETEGFDNDQNDEEQKF